MKMIIDVHVSIEKKTCTFQNLQISTIQHSFYLPLFLHFCPPSLYTMYQSPKTEAVLQSI